jgi:hypothetical protein
VKAGDLFRGHMSIGSEFSQVAGRVGQAIWPSPSKIKAFLESLGRGLSWALVLMLTIAIPLIGLSFFIEQLGISWSVDDMFRSIVMLALLGSGSFIQLVIDATAFEGEKVFLELGFIPSLVTLLIGFLAYRAGSRIRDFRNSPEPIKQLAGFSSIGLGTGFAGGLYLATLLAAGTVLDFGVVELAPMPLTSILWAFFVVSIPAWLGSLRSGNRKASSAWRWSFAAVRTFGIFYLTLMGVVGIVSFGYFVTAPSFASSLPLPSTEIVPGPNGWVTLLVVVGILLFLPTLVFNFFAIAIGAEYAYQIDYLGLDVLSLVEGMDWLSQISIVTSFGPVSALSIGGIIAFVVILAAVVLSSLISGAAATGKASFNLEFRRDLVVGLVVVFFVGFTLRSITQITGVWTNLGVQSHDASDGSLPLQEGSISVGITTASLAFVLALITLFLVVGGGRSASFIHQSFPRLVSSLSGRTLDSGVDRELLPMFFGKLVTVIVTLAILIPIGVAATERTWAAIDGPRSKFEVVRSLIETGELETVKEFFIPNSEDKANWLPDAVLESARPTEASRQSLEVTNFWDNPWQVGQLDALGKLAWKLPSGVVELKLETEAKVSEHLRFIHHVNYTATTERFKLNVSLGEFMTAAKRSELSVNGVKVPAGSYDAIPGVYEVRSPGFQLIAPSESVFVTKESDMTFMAKEEPLVPISAGKILDKEINRLAQICDNFETLNTARCFTFEQIFESRKPIGPAPAENYFAIKTGEFKVLKTTCSGLAKDELLSASSVIRTDTCNTDMTFEATFYESKIKVSDVFRTQTYNACPGLSIPCTRSRQVKAGTKETEVIGDRIGRGTMESSVPFQVKAMGTLRNDGSFEIIDRFVPPVYDIPEPVVEKPEVSAPVKLLGYYKNLAALKKAHPTADLGDGYVVGRDLKLYVWDGSEWTLVGRR